MGRIGKRALEIPAGVEVKIEGGLITVKGPKGTLTQSVAAPVTVQRQENRLVTLCDGCERAGLSLQGTYNALISNMIQGVTQGFEKELELVGVGYRAQMQGKKLQLQLGYSHPLEVEPPLGIEITVAGANKIKIKGADSQVVGHVAAEIRRLREVEPYKGKGVKYAGELVRKKAGKAAKAVGGTGA